MMKKYEKEHNEKFDGFTTTLSVSRYKNTEQIFNAGHKVSDSFLKYNFKENDGEKKGIEITKKLGLYRQKYCGCEFSMN